MLAINAGFGSPGNTKDVTKAVAVALAESGGRVGALNSNRDGSIDRGLWQINSIHKSFDGARLLSDPLYNAQAAFKVYTDAGRSFSPWVAYKTGAYTVHMPSARRAVKWATSGKTGSGKVHTELDAGIAQPVVDAADRAGDAMTGWVEDLANKIWPIMLQGALATTALALIGFGLVKGLGASGKTKEVVTKAAPVAAGAAK